MGDFLKGLDEMLGLGEQNPTRPDESPSQRVIGEVRTQLPDESESEFEEPAPAPEADELPKDRDLFKDMLDAALAVEGIDGKAEARRRYDPMKGDLSSHEWEMQREVLFSGEKYKFKCKRCLKWLSVGGDQTMTQAYEEQGVDPVCGNNIVNEIQGA